MRILAGSPEPLGATWDGRGVNFALFSEHATGVELCLFDRAGRRETQRIALPEYTVGVWHGYLPEVRPGQLYGYRVHGPYEPSQGHRFNANKLLVDPYARQLAGRLTWHPALHGYRVGARRADLGFDRRDSAPLVPKAVVTLPDSPVDPASRPHRPWPETVIYEAHVRGLTMRHPDVPPALRGTYAALAQPAVVDHLVRLGVTAIELLPVHAFADEFFLAERGLRNYWGYNSFAFLAPMQRYMDESGAIGLKAAIATLHDAGIEVILDVVYNHTAEGNELGPTLSLRGIDNASYYHLSPQDRRHCWDSTGCGNSLNLSHPRVVQLVMDSLRHWVQAYGVDGFRFDLATELARNPTEFTAHAPLLTALRQDPAMAGVKLIAEPWDLGDGGYRLGGFPPGWAEWNDTFRNSVRGFWRGDDGQLPDLARGLAGSREVFGRLGRRPWASVNHVTAHDGFTLADLVSYDRPHNEANPNEDGHEHNLSWNCGVEGPTEDPEVLGLRRRQRYNLLATLLLSKGTPMLLAGDEMVHSQQGNNNAYCQDNAMTWLDWERAGEPEQARLTAFVARVLEIRRSYAVIAEPRFFTGETVESGLRDVHWLSPEGREMTGDDWSLAFARCLGMLMGVAAADRARLLLLVNAHNDIVHFRLPPESLGAGWRLLLDTGTEDGLPADDAGRDWRPGTVLTLPGHTLLLLHETGAE